MKVLALKELLVTSNKREWFQNYTLVCFDNETQRATHVQGGAVNRGLKRFFHCIGLHVLLKLMIGLKSTGWCGLDPWLAIYSILTSFFLATA